MFTKKLEYLFVALTFFTVALLGKLILNLFDRKRDRKSEATVREMYEDLFPPKWWNEIEKELTK